jgi:aminoglycoside phosphotransferase (APT) family kinase protein
LNHGDFRLDNLFFQSNGEDPILIDFQTVNVFNPMADVAYFLLPNLNDEAQKSVVDLVRFYWDHLTDNGVSDYSWEDCQKGA